MAGFVTVALKKKVSTKHIIIISDKEEKEEIQLIKKNPSARLKSKNKSSLNYSKKAFL